MNKIFFIFILISTLITADDNLILLNKDNLNKIKLKIEKKDSFVTPAFSKLILDAEEAMKEKNLVVTTKKVLPSSGNKHDYLSFGPYWWPNPETETGFPYIQKDGQTNPESKTESDSPKLAKLARITEVLSLSYFYTGDKKYAKQASELIYNWFLNPETKMNPHLKYGQAIPGKIDGRAIGIIDARHLIRILDSVNLIKTSGYFTPKNENDLKLWMSQYNQWLKEGEYSYEKSNWPNNHGTYYDYQVVGISIFTEDFDFAKKTLEKSQYKRLASHIGTKGQNFHELERTRPLHYSIFDLEALVGLAVYSDKFKEIDFWQFTANKASLKKAIDFIVKYKENPDEWIDKKEKVDFKSFAGILLIASQKYNDKKYITVIDDLWKLDPENINYLKWNKYM